MICLAFRLALCRFVPCQTRQIFAWYLAWLFLISEPTDLSVNILCSHFRYKMAAVKTARCGHACTSWPIAKTLARVITSCRGMSIFWNPLIIHILKNFMFRLRCKMAAVKTVGFSHAYTCLLTAMTFARVITSFWGMTIYSRQAHP